MSTPAPEAAGAGAANVKLTAEQIRALFDILTHRETYAEIEGFKYPDAVTSYGYPFSKETIIPPPGRSGGTTPFSLSAAPSRARTPVPAEEAGVSAGVGKLSLGDGEKAEVEEKSRSPVLQTLFTRFVLTLPWMKDLPQGFWATRVQGILSRFAEAELSESYDKGSLGLRKTLATGSSALLEMVGRGALGRVKREDKPDSEKKYDYSRAEDLERAWDDAMQGLIYGDLVESACAHMVHTDDLEAHSPTIKGAALYSLYQYVPFPPIYHLPLTSLASLPSSTTSSSSPPRASTFSSSSKMSTTSSRTRWSSRRCA